MPFPKDKLTDKQEKFIEAFKRTGDQVQATIDAGYSVKTAKNTSYNLVKNKKLAPILNEWKMKKASDITKNDFIDLALDDYRNLEPNESNKPRFLTIAGQALGYIGTETQQITNNTLNLVQMKIDDRNSGAILENVRKLIENQ